MDIKKIIIKNKFSFLIILLIFILNIYHIVDYNEHSKVIDNYKEYDIKKYNYMGYIQIDRVNIKREIVLGINEDNLKNHVCLSNVSKNLESDNIILAGHSIKNIFQNLHDVIIGDKIIISSFDANYYYEVVSIDIVSKYDIDIIDKSNLILITCMEDNNKRLIIKAKRV